MANGGVRDRERSEAKALEHNEFGADEDLHVRPCNLQPQLHPGMVHNSLDG